MALQFLAFFSYVNWFMPLMRKRSRYGLMFVGALSVMVLVLLMFVGVKWWVRTPLPPAEVSRSAQRLLRPPAPVTNLKITVQ